MGEKRGQACESSSADNRDDGRDVDGHVRAVFLNPGLNAVRADDRLAVRVFQDDLNQGRLLGKDVRGMRDMPEPRPACAATSGILRANSAP